MKNSNGIALGIVALLILSTIFIHSCTTDSSSEMQLSSDFPVYSIDYSLPLENVQTQFDNEMWQTFIALCWPADNLKPDPKGSISDQMDARSVFENYSFNYDVFLLNVNDTTHFEPVAWGDTAALDHQRRKRWERWHNHSEYCPDLVAAAQANGITNMAQILPLDEFIQASNDEKPHVPLVDLKQNFVWSGVVFNNVTFDFVITNELYSPNGLVKAKKNVVEEEVHQVNAKKDSQGNIIYTDTTFKQMVNHMRDKPGAIHLKTSWKIMESGDDTTKFHTAWAALLFNNLNFADSKTWQPQCELVKVGLVGMHITVKTEDQPNAIWATFEHVDNCPEVELIQNKHYNFYNPSSQNPINVAPPANETIQDTTVKEPKWFNPNGPAVTAGQIARAVPIPSSTQTLNQSYQEALKGTVWANYQLVGTQWTDPNSQKVYPKLLSNTTLETFDQLGSSCFGCHHQVTANTLKGGPNNDQFTMDPYPIGNVLNLRLNLLDPPVEPGVIDTAIYSDYMWSLLKWTEYGHLTWKQTK